MKQIQALKEIALLGGLTDDVAVSSRELGALMGTSQQSASNYILSLAEDGCIQRRMGAKKQLIRITKKGEQLLHSEYSQYQRIFGEHQSRLVLRGRVETGFGEGQYYITQKGYMGQFKRELDRVSSVSA